MPRLTFILLATSALVAAPFANATPAPATFHGDWQSPCDAWGTPAICTSTWNVGIHASHLVQTYSIVSAADGSQIFAGRGLYRIMDGKVDGIWEDSRGQILPLAGTYQDTKLNVIWGEASNEIGRSVYTLEGDDLQVVDSVLTEDGWRPFMTIDYARAE